MEGAESGLTEKRGILLLLGCPAAIIAVDSGMYSVWRAYDTAAGYDIRRLRNSFFIVEIAQIV